MSGRKVRPLRPQGVACPRCNAARGEPCRNGETLIEPAHPERYDAEHAARRVAKPVTIPAMREDAAGKSWTFELADGWKARVFRGAERMGAWVQLMSLTAESYRDVNAATLRLAADIIDASRVERWAVCPNVPHDMVEIEVADGPDRAADSERAAEMLVKMMATYQPPARRR